MQKYTFDVVIAGGGLAGMGLAHQLKTGHPELNIAVLEKRKFPLPRAIAKVGESTIEIGSHYLEDTLGLGDHLHNRQLKKFGIRCFFGKPTKDFAKQDELGASQTFGIPTFQLDRGDLENHLADTVKALGVRLMDGVTTNAVNLNGKQHHVAADTEDGEKHFTSRWLIDASGRQALVKRKLNLAKSNDHMGNAVWFRIKRRIEVDDWTDSTEWQSRCSPQGERWLSTNHLMGPGYWVWIIPLASGVTSIGIVMDDQAFEDAAIDSFDKATKWLEKHQARCATAIADAELMDFCVLRNYSYGCKQVFSDHGWGITGEAGVFTDPFYSPGSDFIAINNTFINHLVQQERQGKNILIESAVFQKLFNSFYENSLSLYSGQYGGFGDRRMMGLKLLWDYSYYWGVLSLLFFQKSITNIMLMRDMNEPLLKAQMLHATIQERFRERAAKRLILPSVGVFMNQYEIPCLQYFNKVLMESEQVESLGQITTNVAILERLSQYILDMLSDDAKTTPCEDERELLGEYRKAVLA